MTILYIQILLAIILCAIGGMQLVTDPGRSDRPRYYLPGLAGLLFLVLAFSSGLSVNTWHETKEQSARSEKERAKLQQRLAVLQRETEFIGEVTTAQLKTGRYLASLDEPIVSMQLMLSLNETRLFGDLLPFLIV